MKEAANLSFVEDFACIKAGNAHRILKFHVQIRGTEGLQSGVPH